MEVNGVGERMKKSWCRHLDDLEIGDVITVKANGYPTSGAYTGLAKVSGAWRIGVRQRDGNEFLFKTKSVDDLVVLERRSSASSS